MKITVQKDEWLLLNNNGGDFIGNYPESSYMPLKRKEQMKTNENEFGSFKGKKKSFKEHNFQSS